MDRKTKPVWYNEDTDSLKYIRQEDAEGYDHQEREWIQHIKEKGRLLFVAY